MQVKISKKFFSLYINNDFFNRAVEINEIINRLNTSPIINIVSGGNDTGKSKLLNHIFYQNFYKIKPFNLIHVDFRKFPCYSLHDFARAIYLCTPKSYFENLKEYLPENKKVELLGLFNFEFMKKTEKFTLSDLSDMFMSIEKTTPFFMESKYTNVIFFDEVNKLNNLYKTEDGKLAAEYFFDWITLFTKQTGKFHVFFGTSDSFFVHELQKKIGDERCSFLTIGDLLYDEAYAYFQEEIKKYDPEKQKILRDLNFKDDIFDFVGGRIFHINMAINDYVKGKKCKDSSPFNSATTAYYDALNISKGKIGGISFKNKKEWENDALIDAMKRIAQYGYIQYRGKDEKIIDQLLSLTSCNLLNYRKEAPLKEDIIGLSKDDYPVFISPSPIRHKVIKTIVEKNFQF